MSPHNHQIFLIQLTILLLISLLIVNICYGRILMNTLNIDNKNKSPLHMLTETEAEARGATKGISRQLLFGGKGKETDPPSFIRLVVMRLIYGIASTMGLEERLEGAFNGIFVPPNADGDIFGLGGGGDGGGDNDDYFGDGGDGVAEIFDV